jgi:SAM-dependent methyltransferase
VNLLRLSIECSNQVFGRLCAKRIHDIPKGFSSVRMNLGCGLAVAKGWVNIDGSLNALVAAMPTAFHVLMYRLTGASKYYSESEYCRILRDHIFIYQDLSNGIPFKDGVADYIYSSHFIEHLYRKDAKHLLKECYRVLKNDGVLRISVPDLEYAVKLYSSGNKQEMLQKYFFVEDSESHYARHKYMYDFEMLSALLRKIGFHDPQRCEFRIGATPDIDILDNSPEESLFVEARK